MTSLSNTSPSSALTDAPFQADTPNADVVLRSSDGGMFFVHKIILQYASPVFKDMLSIPQPSRPAHEEDTDSESGLPVIRLTEESETVERILRLSYPVAEPAFRDVADTVKMLEAAEKYQMHLVVTRMEHPVYAFVDSEPLAAYAIACRYTFRDVARAAAVRVRKAVVAAGSSQTHRPQLDYIPEMDGAPWTRTTTWSSFPTLVLEQREGTPYGVPSHVDSHNRRAVGEAAARSDEGPLVVVVNPSPSSLPIF